MSDWTAAHEFSHLLLPFTPSDRWFSEGFASYYQNISRARTGILDEKKAWKKLIEGFERGLKSVQNNNAPILGSKRSHELMQTYWGGAVIALKADIALQEATSGRVDLSSALNSLRNCCLETGREWTAQETFRRLDKLTGTQVFNKLYQLDVSKYKFPEYQSLLRDLGIQKIYSGEIRLNDSAPKAHIRKKIING
jgi:predicted metalloprotease with PDZ domain